MDYLQPAQVNSPNKPMAAGKWEWNIVCAKPETSKRLLLSVYLINAILVGITRFLPDHHLFVPLIHQYVYFMTYTWAVDYIVEITCVYFPLNAYISRTNAEETVR
jgi:hypothetical protein